MTTTSDSPAPGTRRTEGVAGACPAPEQVGQSGGAIVWRSVFDELPDENQTVLICRAGDQDSIQLGAVYAEGAVQEWANNDGEILDQPTHWAELPEVPMEKGVAQ